jgi:hypothetical protein
MIKTIAAVVLVLVVSGCWTQAGLDILSVTVSGLDPYRKSGELPSPLTSHTFKLHWADADQV